MLITAHSGCDETGKNSMAYLRHACTLQVDALEIDIRKAGDGRLLLSHDPIGTDPLVSLEDAFTLMAEHSRHDLRINCDLKEYGLEDAVLRTADTCGLKRERLLFTGSVTDCMHARSQWPDVEIFINAEELIPGFYEPFLAGRRDTDIFPELLKRCREARMQVLNINYRVCPEEVVQLCRKEGIGLSVWTVDDPVEVRRFAEADVVNLTSNRPQMATEVRG